MGKLLQGSKLQCKVRPYQAAIHRSVLGEVAPNGKGDGWLPRKATQPVSRCVTCVHLCHDEVGVRKGAAVDIHLDGHWTAK
jgi:hypothetical protein